MGKDKRNSGLDALKALRDRVPNSVLKTVIARPATKPAPGKAAPPPDELDDAALFRAQVGRIQPLRADNHADLARPKPAPTPRPLGRVVPEKRPPELTKN